MNGRHVNDAWNASSFPDRQRSLCRNASPMISKQCRNDDVLGHTSPELGARNLAHPLQLQLLLGKGTSGTLSTVTLQ